MLQLALERTTVGPILGVELRLEIRAFQHGAALRIGCKLIGDVAMCIGFRANRRCCHVYECKGE